MVATRFALACHIVLLVAQEVARPATSQALASRVNTNPVVVRRINGMLTRAGILRVRRGPGGATLARDPGAISMGDVWAAVNTVTPGSLVPIHPAAAVTTPVDSALRAVLGDALVESELALRAKLAATTIKMLLCEMHQPSRAA